MSTPLRARTPLRAALTAAVAALALPTSASRAAPLPFPGFRVQEVDKSLKVGYGTVLADVNNDGRKDIVVADSNRVIWFENPSWALHTITEGKVKADNVCIDLYDIDGDKQLDLVLGADWQPNNTKSGGSLHWLRRGKTQGEPWQLFPILAELPTLHRAHFGDVTGDGRPELVVGPLKGVNSTGEKNFTDVGAKLLAYSIPKDPTGPWEPMVISDQLHVVHNFHPADFFGDGRPGLLAASYEGVTYFWPAKPGDAGAPAGASAGTGASVTWLSQHLGAGNQSTPAASRGSSEVKPGLLGQGKKFIATIEPFHGHEVVVYTPPAAGEGLWTRTVIDDQLKSGHAVWCADLDGDGADEIVIGFRDPLGRGIGPGVNAFKANVPAPGTGTDDTITWEKHTIDDKGMAAEDLTCGDLNNDGKIDIVAVGRATRNVRIYWNEGDAGKATAAPGSPDRPIRRGPPGQAENRKG